MHYNKDDATVHYDDNGFLVRPSPIGSVFSSGMIRPHSVHAAYIGWTGDGHIGPVNLTHAFYQAFGNDSFNRHRRKAGHDQRAIGRAGTFLDKDWFRIKGSVFYASGSRNPSSSRARGFDSIDDFPEFAGGIFSLWNRESIRLTGSGVELNPGNSLLPDLRSNKDEGQANFVNPGILLTNLGADFDITPKLRGFANVNYLRFEHTEVTRADTIPIADPPCDRRGFQPRRALSAAAHGKHRNHGRCRDAGPWAGPARHLHGQNSLFAFHGRAVPILREGNC